MPEEDEKTGRHPCRRIFIGRLGDFTVLPSDVYHFARQGGNHPQDTQQIRYVKLPTRTTLQSQTIGEASMQRLERRNTPVEWPQGTLVNDWGEAILPVVV